MNVVFCSEADDTTLFSRFVRDRRRTGCTLMTRRYSSVREKAHLHLLAVKVYKWFVMTHYWAEGKTVAFNTKYSLCAFDANRNQKLLISTKKAPCFPFGLNLAVGQCSQMISEHCTGWTWNSGIGSYCVHLQYLKSIWTSRVLKHKGMSRTT